MFQQPNPGERFAQGFQQGQHNARQNKLRSAMAELARNPDNVKAYEVLAEADPQAAMQYKQQRIEQAKASLQQYQGQLGVGAKIIRQVQPKDQAGWSQALAMAQQYGVDVSQIPQAWDQGGSEYAQNLSGLANALFPEKQNEGPSSYQEYQRAQADPAYAKFLTERQGPLIANNGDGTFTIIPRQTIQGTQPAPQAGGDVPPPPPGFQLDNGGPTPPASGAFPPSGN
jgi:hypothetical protein